jgi:trehalose 6-phosphate phosphatase
MWNESQSSNISEADTLPDGESLLARLLETPEQFALFLDIDGTLLDLSETPDAIVVPDDLPGNLNLLSVRFGGALALITGRAMAYADDLFRPYSFTLAGLHGAERRAADGRITKVASTPQFEKLKIDLATATKDWDGVLIEDKGAAIAAHYRLAPDREIDLDPLMLEMLHRAGPDWHLQHGKMVIELRPSSADKGHAVETFLSTPPFKGRRPIAIGDDVTDEAMFRAVNELSGCSIRIGSTPHTSEAIASIASPARLRDIIAHASS